IACPSDLQTMLRKISVVLILGGLGIAGYGVYSIWTARQGEKQAEEEWESQMARRPRGTPRVRKGETLARLSIERLGSGWFEVEGSGKDELRLGPGHLMDTALPGSNGKCGIAGH